MLFPYTYVPHQIEKMQEFIDFIFLEVWCKAPVGLVFRPDLFQGNLDLKEIMSEFGFSAKAAERGKSFYKDVKAIYELFAQLSALEIDQFKLWYQGNNDLEKICANDPKIHLARYSDIEVTHPDLANLLGIFFKGLYSQSLLDLAPLRAKIGEIDDHYQSFVQANRTRKCPFCGISDLLGEYHSKREAYDHYLPKALYPFNSINFRNLVPACHHCNSNYKTSKDPAYTPKDPARGQHRRAVFYPFKAASHRIELQVELLQSDIANLTPEHITLLFGPAAISQEIDTWRDIYGIEERYKAKLCSSDSNDWIEEFRLLNRRRLIPAKEYLEDLEDLDPFSNCNFLRRAFLRASNEIGILEAFEQYKDDNAEYDNGKEGNEK